MSNIVEQKCPACGAPMRFDPESGLFVCDYCGSSGRTHSGSGRKF